MGTLPKPKFPDASQGQALQTRFSKDGSLRPAVLTLFCTISHSGGVGRKVFKESGKKSYWVIAEHSTSSAWGSQGELHLSSWYLSWILQELWGFSKPGVKKGFPPCKSNYIHCRYGDYGEILCGGSTGCDGESDTGEWLEQEHGVF